MTSAETLNKQIIVYQARRAGLLERKPRVFIADIINEDLTEDTNVRLISNSMPTLVKFVICHEDLQFPQPKIVFPDKIKGKISYASEALVIKPIKKRGRYFRRFWEAYIDEKSEEVS